MRTIHTTALIILTAVLSAAATSAKEWRGIVPLHSTREDVRRLLGPAHKEDLPHAALYEFADETAVVYFQAFPCDGCGIGWNVPVGTVTGIGVIPKSKFQKEKFLSEGTFKKDKTDSIFAYYINEEDGLTVEEYGNTVTLLTYEPGRNEASAHCPAVRGCIADYFPKFDEYENLPFEDEKARLDNFVISMRDRMSRGVMIVYGPNPAAQTKQLKRAERAKKYLVNKRGLGSLRLLIVDGGYKDTAIAELQLYGIGGLVSHIYLTLEKDPKQK
ncbi:MAG: hypothetical protein AABM67_21300 [Acidobacteriota bacterium]